MKFIETKNYYYHIIIIIVVVDTEDGAQWHFTIELHLQPILF